MSALPADPVPQYRRVKNHIAERIAAGEWVPGARVPSEGELTRRFGLSRMTVNRALRELVAEGQIVRIQGVGSFVAQRKAESAIFAVRNIAEEIASSGRRHTAEVLVLESKRDPEIAARLGLGPDEQVFHSVLVHRADGLPVQLEDRWVNPRFAPDYLAQDFRSITPNQHLTALAPYQRFEHVVEAETPSPEVARRLQLEPGEPCLVLSRRTWARGMVSSVARLIHPARRYRLAGQLGDAPASFELPPL
ncbi:MAG: histidine utilization repressor [Alphaproteobacteria bacterium]|nr:histidine utilization repressor [Alphaproteobacteria bacterium]